MYEECILDIENQDKSCESQTDSQKIAADSAMKLCEQISEHFNISEKNCNITPNTVTAYAKSGVFDINPHIVFTNGLKLYIGSDYGEIDDLSDAENEDDRTGYILYIDINGTLGAGKLWDDVYPFYKLKSGKIITGYKKGAQDGKNYNNLISVNVLYDYYSGENREERLLITDADYHRAACISGYIKSQKYCGAILQDDICKDMVKDCRMIVKKPIKIF